MRLNKLFKSFVPWRIKLWLKARRSPDIATPKDLLYCYRLILGREPDSDGWQTYMESIRHGAMTRARLVRAFLESVEFGVSSASGNTAEDSPVAVNLPEFLIYVRNTESAIGHEIYNTHSYESEVTAAVKQTLGPGMTFIDIGCNIGYFSLMAARVVGESGIVFSYDPSETNCALLRRSATENGFQNIDVRSKPLADKVSQYTYFERGGNGVLHELSGDTPTACGPVVTTAVLDKDLADVASIDVIKLDVEGAEHLVMLGAKALLEKHRPVILSEFSPKGLEQVSQISPREYLDYMIGLGYHVSILSPDQSPIALGADSSAVMDYWKRKGGDHVDLIFVAAEQSIPGDALNAPPAE